MKKHSFKIFGKITGTLLAAAFVVTGASATTITTDTIYNDKAAIVKYIGTDTDSYVFNVSYDNKNGDRFILRIIDAAGNTLYTGSYNDKKFSKRFRLLKDGNDKVNFVIRNLKDNSTQTFTVATTRQVVEDIVITKAKE